MFDLDRFIEDCIHARREDESHKAVREVVNAAVTDPSGIFEALGEPAGAGFEPLYQGDDLTILNFTWAPLMTLMPHNHNAWAVIGIYSGREDNIFWRKTDDDRIEAAGAKSLMPGSASALGREIVHSVTNPTEKLTSAIHVYGGDFFAPGRSEWDPETLEERPFDIDKSRRIFREANERFALGG
jgi:predicted metal-dependent enzyme (double-stranded beta helix superfamily)